MGRPKLVRSNSSDTDLSARLDSTPRDSSLVGQASLDWRGTTSSGYARTETAPTGRGPAYLNGASHGSTGLAPPLWKYEFERPGGDDFWHTESRSSPSLFNRKKHQYVYGSDRPINGDELGDWNLPGKTLAQGSTKPLDRLERRKSFTQRPIAIVSGTHGAWHGNNWDTTGQRDSHAVEQAFLSEDVVKRLNGRFTDNPRGPFWGYNNHGVRVKGDLTGYTLKNGQKGRPDYYISDSAKKGSFESRIRIYDAATLTESDLRLLIDDLGNHVILGYCFSRNEESLRHTRGLAPVTSYQSEEKLPLNFGPGLGLYAPEGTILISGAGKKIPVLPGSFIEDSPTGYHELLITPPGGGRPSATGPNVSLWLPCSYSPDDSQAPTKAIYKAHNP